MSNTHTTSDQPLLRRGPRVMFGDISEYRGIFEAWPEFRVWVTEEDGTMTPALYERPSAPGLVLIRSHITGETRVCWTAQVTWADTAETVAQRMWPFDLDR